MSVMLCARLRVRMARRSCAAAHQSDSNCTWASGWASSVTKCGTRPTSMQSSIGGSFGIESSLRSARVARSAFASPSGAPFVATQPLTIAPSDATSFGSSGAPAGDAVVASASSAGAVAAKLRRFIMLSSFFDLRSLTSLSIRFLRHSSLSRPPFGLRRSEVSRPMASAAALSVSVSLRAGESGRERSEEGVGVGRGEREPTSFKSKSRSAVRSPQSDRHPLLRKCSAVAPSHSSPASPRSPARRSAASRPRPPRRRSSSRPPRSARPMRWASASRARRALSLIHI